MESSLRIDKSWPQYIIVETTEYAIGMHLYVDITLEMENPYTSHIHGETMIWLCLLYISLLIKLKSNIMLPF